MALGVNERWREGFVVDVSTDPPVLVTTTTTSGATFQEGFLRDPDGRLVVREVVAGEGVVIS